MHNWISELKLNNKTRLLIQFASIHYFFEHAKIFLRHFHIEPLTSRHQKCFFFLTETKFGEFFLPFHFIDASFEKKDRFFLMFYHHAQTFKVFIPPSYVYPVCVCVFSPFLFQCALKLKRLKVFKLTKADVSWWLLEPQFDVPISLQNVNKFCGSDILSVINLKILRDSLNK